MKYPSRSEYATAIRNPAFAFRKVDPRTKVQQDLDSSLVGGQGIQRVSPNGMQSVWSASGGYAIAFKYQTKNPAQLWAIRCFFRVNYDTQAHYQHALEQLKKSNCASYFANTFYLHEGIRVQGKCYPILKMEWVEGCNLKTYIRDNLSKKKRLLQLADLWRSLSMELSQGGIAHGDLQHGNVLVVAETGQPSLKLIDYDSLHFQTNLTQVVDVIKGLPGYQHPARKALKYRCLEIDFFPQLIIYVCILALAENPSLWKTYQLDKTDHLLFSKKSFTESERSQIFQDLAKLPQPIPRLTEQIKQFCRFDNIQTLPSLEEVISGQRVRLPTVQKISPTVPPILETSNVRPQPKAIPQPIQSGKGLNTKSLFDTDIYRRWAQEYYRKRSRGSTL